MAAQAPVDYDHLFKILLVGDSGTALFYRFFVFSSYIHLNAGSMTFPLPIVPATGVGKTSMLLAFTTDEFVDREKPTIGVDLKVKMLDHNGKRLKLTIWDTAGQERYKTLTSAYYRGAQGIILVYDTSSKQSFENVQSWLKEVVCISINIVPFREHE
jgi:hypothetical protein